MKKSVILLALVAFGSVLFAAPAPKVKLDAAAAKKSYGTFTIEPKDSTVTVTKTKITIAPNEEGQVYTISGYFNGQIINKTKNTVIRLNNVYLENKYGEPSLFGNAKTEVSSVKGSENWIVSSGKNESKTAALQSKKNLVIGGSGKLTIVGNTYHAVKADDVKIKGSGTIYLQGTKKGAALNCTSLTVEEGKEFNCYLVNSKNGIKADNTVLINSGTFYIYDNETGIKTDTVKDAPNEPHGITLAGGTFYGAGNKFFYETQKDSFDGDGAEIIAE